MHYNNHESLTHEPIERLPMTEQYYLGPQRGLGISLYQNDQFNKSIFFTSLRFPYTGKRFL